LDPDFIHGFYVGDWLVEPLKGQVSGRRGNVHLPPKAAEVLICLAKHPTELVTRETLLAEVWGADQGSPEALSRAVSEIRHALDDHANDPQFIQTLPKRGYRLLVTPELVTDTTASVVLGAEHGARITDIGFLENLRQRGVLETGLAYLLVGWLLIQISDTVFHRLLLPDWTATFVTVLVIAGLPLALVLSWYLEFRDGRAVLDERSPADARKRRFSRTYMSIIGALGIAAVMVYVYDRSVGLPRAESRADLSVDTSVTLPTIQDNSIGVLRFFALDPSEKTRIFSNAIAEDVITSLSLVPGLLVASRGDSFALEPNTASSRVRERLRVAKYIEGSIQIDGDIMRVVVQLVDSKTGFHILSRTFDRALGDYFNMRDEITGLTVANVRVALPPATRTAPTSVEPDPDIDVYVMYRRGIDASRQPDIKESIEEALEWFNAALAVDPEFAAAHAGLCDVHVEGYVWLDDAAHIEAAESSCTTALSLNPNLDVVYTSLGDLYEITGRLDRAEDAYLDALEIDPENVAALIGLGEVYRQQQRPEEAEASLRQAAGLDPGDWSAYNALGTFLFRSGRFAEAAAQYRNMVALDRTNVRGHTNLASALMLAEEFEAAEPVFRRALELEPGGLTYSNFGMLLYNLGRFDEAVEVHRKAAALEQQDYLVRSNFGDALWAAGRRTEAKAVFGEAKKLALKALQVNPNDAFTLMDLAWISTSLGEHDDARELIDRAMQIVPDDPYVHYIQGLMLNRRGNPSAAMAALRTAIELGYSTKMLAGDPNLSNLHADSRFQDLLAQSK